MKTPATNRKLNINSIWLHITLIRQHFYSPNPVNIKIQKSCSRQKPPENAFIPEKWIVLIINDLSTKTRETTGNKPEIKHKLYMTTYNNNTPTLIQPKSCKSKNPEIVFQTNKQPVNTYIPFSSHSFIAKATAKMNSIDNQWVNPQNPWKHLLVAIAF
jgi:hypothetical protein